MIELPQLSDEQKLELVHRLETLGMVTRDKDRLVLTTFGHLSGAMLYAIALQQQGEMAQLN